MTVYNFGCTDCDEKDAKITSLLAERDELQREINDMVDGWAASKADRVSLAWKAAAAEAAGHARGVEEAASGVEHATVGVWSWTRGQVAADIRALLPAPSAPSPAKEWRRLRPGEWIGKSDFCCDPRTAPVEVTSDFPVQMTAGHHPHLTVAGAAEMAQRGVSAKAPEPPHAFSPCAQPGCTNPLCAPSASSTASGEASITDLDVDEALRVGAARRWVVENPGIKATPCACGLFAHVGGFATAGHVYPSMGDCTPRRSPLGLPAATTGERCAACDGSGERFMSRFDGDVDPPARRCSECRGTGRTTKGGAK